MEGIIQNHLWDWKHCETVFLKQLIVCASLLPPISYLVFWNFEIYCSEMVKNSIRQRWRKHSDLLLWTDLKSMWKLPTFIHSWSFEVSLPVFKFSGNLPKLESTVKINIQKSLLSIQFLIFFMDWENLESPAFSNIQISQFSVSLSIGKTC